MRRRALTEMAAGVTPQQVAELPLLALSNEFSRDALSEIPADRAAWARSVNK